MIVFCYGFANALADHMPPLCVFLIPKMDILSIGNFNAGLRIDDFIILFIFIFFLMNIVYSHELKITKTELMFYLFIATSFLGTLISSLFYSRGTILFPIRFIEYFVFFYIGAFLSRNDFNIRNLILAVFVANCAVALMQNFHIIGGFNVRGYQPDVSERVIGLTSGPWELGVILNFVICYFLINAKKTYSRYAILAIATVFIMLTGSRMAMLAQALIFLIFMLSNNTVLSLFKKAFIAIPIVIVVYMYFGDSNVALRSDALLNYSNIQTAADYFRGVSVSEHVPDWDTLGMMSGDDIDMSWSMRATKWAYAFKLFLTSPLYWIFGVGAGSFGNALDGAWLRLLSEHGVLGLSFFVAFLLKVRKFGSTMNLFVIAFAINMLMIDIYMSYKVMSMFLFFAGYYHIKDRYNLS